MPSPSAALMPSAVVPLLAVLYSLGFLNIFLRSSIGVMGPDISREMSLSPAMLSAVGSAFFFAYAALQVPTGMLLDRFGARTTMPALLVLTFAGVMLFAVGTAPWVLILARVMMGLGCAGVFIGAFFVLARWYPPDRLVSQAANVNSFASLGSICAATPLAALIAVIGWRNSTWGFALLVAVVAVATAFFVRDDPPGVVRPPAERESWAKVAAGVKEAMRQPGMRRLAFIGFPMSAGSTITNLWGAPYLRDVHGLGEISRGNVLLLLAIAGMAGHFIYGQIARRTGSVRRLIRGGGASLTLALALMAAMAHPPLWLVALLFSISSLTSAYPGLAHGHARALVPARLTGRGVAAINMGIMSAIALMQLLFGWVVGTFAPVAGKLPEEAYRTAFGMQAAVAIVALAIYWRTPETKGSA